MSALPGYALAIVSSQQSVSPGVAIPSPLQPGGVLGDFSDRLLVLELPDLPEDRRHDTVAFVCRRADQMPTPLRLGLVILTSSVGIAERAVGPERTTQFLTTTSLPLVGELARMVRALAFAFIWETWPATLPSGGSGSSGGAGSSGGSGSSGGPG